MRHQGSIALLFAVSLLGGNARGGEGDVRPADELCKPKVFTNAQGETLNYRVYTPPKFNPRKKYPLVLYFHGAGERGNDNVTQLANGTKYILAYSERSKQPMIFVAPQCPANMQWVDVPWDAAAHTMPASPSTPMRLTMELIRQMIKQKTVDANRVYVMGISMGGFGTWDAIQRYPEVFAAAMPICGGGDPQLADKIKDVPVWAFHGDKDVCVQTQRSRTMVEAIKKAGGSPQYTEYKGVGHVCWDEAFKNDDVMKWFFSQKKQ